MLHLLRLGHIMIVKGISVNLKLFLRHLLLSIIIIIFYKSRVQAKLSPHSVILRQLINCPKIINRKVLQIFHYVVSFWNIISNCFSAKQNLFSLLQFYWLVGKIICELSIFLKLSCKSGLQNYCYAKVALWFCQGLCQTYV